MKTRKRVKRKNSYHSFLKTFLMSDNQTEEIIKEQDTIKQDDERLELIEDSKRSAYLWLFIGVLFFLVSILLGFFAYRAMHSSDEGPFESLRSLSMQLSKENSKESNEGKVRRLIDGVYVEEGKENFYPMAFMIDNHVDARPPAGLAKANLVFEAEAEGGVTRFMAVFASDEDVKKIGPVRSARPYFVDWARELSALYGHVGGSPEALAYMKKDNVLHINEFYNGGYYWRDEARPRPHNVFTSTESMNAYLEKMELPEGKFLPWQYKDDETRESRGEVDSIYIPYRLAYYKVEWKYDVETNGYVRYVSGFEHRDDAGQEIRAKNIIIQIADAEVLDNELRLKMETIGEGKAILCLDGYCFDAKWQKNSATARTRFYDESGAELKLNAGTTWVQVVRPDIEFVTE